MPPITRKKVMRTAYQNHIQKLINGFKDSPKNDVTDLKAIKHCLIGKMAEVKKLDMEVVDLIEDDDGVSEEITSTLSYSDEITKHLAIIDKHIDLLENTTKATTSVKAEPVDYLKTYEHNIRMPKLSVPSFDGNVLDFRGFWDQFNVAVHSNDRLSEIEKFTYLKGLVKKSASNLLCGLSLTKDNYSKAIDLLNERFGNSQTLISSNMDVLVKIPKVENIADVKKLRVVYDSLETSIRNLSDLGVERETYGSLLINIIFERIPSELRVIISRTFKDDKWSLDGLMKCFKDELYARERCGAVSNGSQNIDDDDDFTAQCL